MKIGRCATVPRSESMRAKRDMFSSTIRGQNMRTHPLRRGCAQRLNGSESSLLQLESRFAV